MKKIYAMKAEIKSENRQSAHLLNTVIRQTQNNTTLWVGSTSQPRTECIAGQTFQCPCDGLVENIRVFPSAISEPGIVLLTLHEFHADIRQWGEPLVTGEREIDKVDLQNWVCFR
ncbi:MAG: hypothetical protein N2747_09280 [Chitinophagaceae bacterium]|nr:hypothetical protein [Chitinophagaceae bacterium]